MQTGFYYKGLHTSTLGVSVATRQRAVLPDMKRITFEATAADGITDLSAANELCRPMYNERVFTINMHITAEDIYALQSKMATIASWLAGNGELVFDDCPGVIWDAAVTEELGFVPERKGKKAIISINFTAKPFSRAQFETREGAKLGDDIMLGYKLPIGLPRTLVYNNITKDSVFSVQNIGTAHTKPIITITGIGSGEETQHTTISINGRKLSFKALKRGITIVDLAKCQITRNGVIYAPTAGVMLELAPGDNQMTVDTFEGASVTVTYTPQFLYGWEV